MSMYHLKSSHEPPKIISGTPSGGHPVIRGTLLQANGFHHIHTGQVWESGRTPWAGLIEPGPTTNYVILAKILDLFAFQ